MNILRNANYSAVVVTIYLAVYCIMLQFEQTRDYAVPMFFLSPVLVCWMVYTVIKHGKYHGRELSKDDEFGYQDKNKEELGVF